MTARDGSTDLDDVDAIEALDAGGLLRAYAGSGAQVRTAVELAGEMALDRIDGARPRAVVVTGVGGSGIAGDALAAIAGNGAPAPVIVHRDYGLPGWVGAADLVIGVSRSGHTRQTLTAMEQALTRGASIGGVGAPDSPLADVVGRGRGAFAAVTTDAPPRAALWAMVIPLVLMARAAGVLATCDDGLHAAADVLDRVAESARPASDGFVNPAKGLAVDLFGSTPMIWGSSQLTGVAALRAACQLAENAKMAALSGVLPEAAYNQIELLRPRSNSGGQRDFFADRAEGEDQSGLRLVLLRDTEEHPALAARADAAHRLADDAGIDVTVLRAESPGPVARLAEQIGLLDFTSVYCGLSHGLDPSLVPGIRDATASAGE